MKKSKISFLAVIALLAMSFTIATHEGTFSKPIKKSQVTFICQPNITAVRWLSGYKSCITGKSYQWGLAPCPISAGTLNFDCGTSFVINKTEHVCTSGAIFCCAYINSDGKPCPVPCTRIQVFCQPQP